MALPGSGNRAVIVKNEQRLRKLKREQARKMLLESLEGRQLMATGPQLIGVQPNQGSLLQNGTVLHVSPRELVFRFDDAVAIDAATLSGVQISRAGADGLFERAYVSSDLGTNGAVVLDFAAASAGLAGNGIEVQFTKVSRSDSRQPVVTVVGQRVNIEVNINAGFKTLAQDVIDAITNNAAASALILPSRLRGSQFAVIADTVPTSAPLVLNGANAAKISTNLNAGPSLQVEFVAQQFGPVGRNIQIVVTSRDMGGQSPPLVTVNGTTINVEMNRNSRFSTTAQELLDAINNDAVASSIVLARFVSGSPATRVGGLTINYSPLKLTGANDIPVVAAYRGLGDTGREIIFRFAEDLPDDVYRVDILGRGPLAVRNVNGQRFNSGVDSGLQFELDLGAKIEAVVPQPVVRQANGSLLQQRNVIEVYFNDDDLYAASTTSLSTLAVSTGLKTFQVANAAEFAVDDLITLVATGSSTNSPRMSGRVATVNATTGQMTVDVSTVEGTGSFGAWGVFPAGSALNPEFYQLRYTRGTVDSNDDIVAIPSRVDYSPSQDRAILTFGRNLDELVDSNNVRLPIKALRLRIGTDEERLPAPVTQDVAQDPGSRFADARDISSVFNPVAGNSKAVILNSSIQNGASQYLLDFPGGNDAPGVRDNRYQSHVNRVDQSGIEIIEYNFQGQLGRANNSIQLNAITEPQKELARQAISLYANYLGVRFVETASRGITIAVGDMQAVVGGTTNGPGGLALASGVLASNGQAAVVVDIQDFNNATDNLLGGDLFRTIMRGLGVQLGLGFADEIPQLTVQSNQPVPAGTELVFPGAQDIINGQFVLRPESKDIDLYRFDLPVAGELRIETIAERLSDPSLLDSALRLFKEQLDGSYVEVAANDDYFSEDSYIKIKVAAGRYIVGVSAKGNSSYNPNLDDSGLGGKSEGNYQLRVDFRPPEQAFMVDASNDGREGDSEIRIDGNADGTPGGTFDFWFVPTGPSNMVLVDKGSKATIPEDGSVASPYRTISTALTRATQLQQTPNNPHNIVVRIVGNGGTDNKLETTNDNQAYEIGFNRLGQAQADGTTFDVPKDMTVMIDSGAILKLMRARISAGSSSVSVDRSGGSLQALGIPRLIDSNGNVIQSLEGNAVPGAVYFTSLHDTLGKGVNADRTAPAAAPGDWGGIDFRNIIDGRDELRTDLERNGLFLNAVVHSNVKFGGGQVSVDGVSQVITPIHILDSRPTVAYNTITRSANAAIAATPNSFKESNFHDPISQAQSNSGAFISDFDRVGPDIHGNKLIDNSVNGLFIKVTTSPASSPEVVSVSGRFDDTDIVHVVSENLIIAGTVGGSIQDAAIPPTTVVTLATRTGGSLAAGQYNYKLVYVDSAGRESPASAATATITVAANGVVDFGNLPPVRSDSGFLARRIYRSSSTGVGPYSFVAQINANATTFTDNGTVTGATLVEASGRRRPRLNGSLVIDPATIVKLQGSRIETQIGAQLIAEGQDGSSVIFTSIDDVRYGASGSFDTANRKGSRTSAAGDWGGIYGGLASSISLDHALIAFGGGTARIEGGFAQFNAIELHQAQARIANSRIEDNDDGVGATTTSRSGRGTNSPGAIFVRGAQPIIVDNIIQRNLGAAINIDANSLDYSLVDDRGRATGAIEKAGTFLANQGPLVDGNLLDGNEINAMRVRGQVLTTGGVWDDTDIVHALFETITISNSYVFGGLRLVSKGLESLVVKLDGTTAGFTATGLPLDIANRIGGSISLEGAPGAPVILTSLNDNTVGAGFTPSGLPQLKTLTNSTDVPAPGDWRGINIATFSNDQNSQSTVERETSESDTPGSNEVPSRSQYLGTLSSSPQSGDENARLGFLINGTLKRNSDIDIYSFVAVGGTEVWFDVDMTSNSLDTVLELIDANGNILALSDNSYAEEQNSGLLYRSPALEATSVNPLRKTTAALFPTDSRGIAAKDTNSTNPRDAGFRVVLPGQSNLATLYHVRVRSSSLAPADAPSKLLDGAQLLAGKTQGAYQLQIRLGETDLVPGSLISYGDLRFATNAIDLAGAPRHSPLVGEFAEQEVRDTNRDGIVDFQGNGVFANAQELGNLLSTDRSTLSVAGTLVSPTGVDWYTFTIDYQLLLTPLAEYFSTIFDIDYADGIGRADTSMYLFNANGNLISSGLNSNILDDRAGPLKGADITDLSRGSAGTLDAYIGSVELPAGRYFLAITNKSREPGALAAFNDANAANPLVRLQPTDGSRLIVEDHVQFDGGSSGDLPTITEFISPATGRVGWTLGDMQLYVSQDAGLYQTNVFIVNPLTGQVSNNVVANPNNLNAVSTMPRDVRDIAFRFNGELRAFDVPLENFAVTTDRDARGFYLNIDTGVGSVVSDGDVAIDTFHLGPNATVVDSNAGIMVEAIAIGLSAGAESGFLVGNRGPGPQAGAYNTNILYEFNTENGNAVSNPSLNRTDNARLAGAGTQIVERGRIKTEPDTGYSDVSRRLSVSEATEVDSRGTRRLLVQGDGFTLRDSANNSYRFEFKSGPELRLLYDLAAGRIVQDGDDFTLDGIVYEFNSVGGVAVGAVAIPYNANMTRAQFVDAIRGAMPASINVGLDGDRLNFSGANVGSFGDLVSRGVAVVQNVNAVTPGSILIDFLAQDTAQVIALRIASAINTLAIPGVNATAIGRDVRVTNSGSFLIVTNANGLYDRVVQSSIRPAEVAPGGLVTGTALINGVLFSVSDRGGLYRVANPGSTFGQGGGEFTRTYVLSSTDLLGISFTGLTAGPQGLENGAYSNILFGTDIQGNIWAFNTAGVLQPVFANGASRISTGIAGITGLAFSTLDFNLWHESTPPVDLTDPTLPLIQGNGLPATPNGSRGASGTDGERSWYFGFNDLGQTDSNFNTIVDPVIRNSINFPGGASGVLESKPMDLSGIGAADQPFLYFNYYLQTQDQNSRIGDGANFMQDSFRVYAGLEDGTWVLLTTNNSDRGGGTADDEFDFTNSGSVNTQETFDNTATWRQARVNLSEIAGQNNVRLRFEFSTAGGFGMGSQGGRGPELRLLAGSRLSDGDTVTINGTVFELEMGASLYVPSGSAIQNGNTLTIEGTTFVFYNGQGVPPASGVVVLYNASQTAEVVAGNLFNAIRNATYSVTTTTGLNFSNETPNGNDTLRFASPTGITGGNASVSGTGVIGDNSIVLAEQSLDIDMVRMDLEVGATVTIDAAATSNVNPLDTYLRLFDSDGTQLAADNDGGGNTNSRITFTVTKSGAYYIGVSAAANRQYSPVVPATAIAGGSTGLYSLNIAVARKFDPKLDGVRIQLPGTRQISVPNNSPFLLNGSLGTTGVPVYVDVDDSANQVAQAMRDAVATALANGSNIVYDVRQEFLSLTGLTVNNPGPFGLTTSRAEDQFSEYAIPNGQGRPAYRARNNAVEGIYLDDFIVGVTERGEMVLGSDATTTFVASAAGTSGNLVGDYQLEIRKGEEYGRPRANGINLVDSFAPNDRLAPGQNIRFRSGSQIPDGATFRISDGVNSMTFEFNDLDSNTGVAPGNVAIDIVTSTIDQNTGTRRAFSANEVARAVREVLNSSTVQSVLNISAIMINGDLNGATSDTLAIFGPATISISSAIGALIIIDQAGDQNTPRDQGQIIVENSRVSFSSQFGIQARPDARDPVSDAASPGAVRNTVVRNNERLVPGAVLVNNELLFNGAGGINITGETDIANRAPGVVPFVRVMNNTVIGGSVSVPAVETPAVFAGIYFPIGTMSFADSVVSYTPSITGAPTPTVNDPAAALGVPNYVGNLEPGVGGNAVSLGRGGQLVVRFDDNYLTPSGDSRPDLYISEVGEPETIRVEASVDGITYRAVGTLANGARVIDLDAFGFRSSDRVTHIRITDEPLQGSVTGINVGADIDAVGAIFSNITETYTVGGTGILIGPNASPTLLNNAIVNSANGIDVDPTSASTIVGGTLYSRNTSDLRGPVTNGQFPLVSPVTTSLFRNIGQLNLYPAQNSLLIDSSIDSLPDRSTLVAVKTQLGLQLSPILTPRNDVNGQLRIDDPTVDTPAGIGENVFKDRGANDRSDFVGPGLFVVGPQDNDTFGKDLNPQNDVIELIDASMKSIDIQINDALEPAGANQGSGIDDATVTSSAVLLYRNGIPMVEGVNYRFGYNPTTGIVRLTPLAGVWSNDAVYTVRFLNTNESEISFLTPSLYTDSSSFTIFDKQGGSKTFELDFGYQLQVPANSEGIHTLVDGGRFVLDDGAKRLRFEFNLTGSVAAGSIAINLLSTDTQAQATDKIAAVLRTNGLNVTVNNLGLGKIQLQGNRTLVFLNDASGLIFTGQPGTRPAYGLRIPTEAGVPVGLTDGQKFTIRLGNGATTTFELDNNGFVAETSVPVSIAGNFSTESIANALVKAIKDAGLGLDPQNTGDGFIAIGGDGFVSIITTDSVLQVVGLPESGASLPIPINLVNVTDSTQIAAIVADAIRAANISGIQITVFGGRILVEGVSGVVGLNAKPVSAIRDLAGNAIRANQENDQAVAVIQLGSGFDYGDAPDPIYTSLNANGGPRHKVVPGFSLGANATVDGDARLVDSDNGDDGVTFASEIYSAFFTQISVTANGISAANRGFLTAWIDFDGDGAFETTERLVTGMSLVNGSNNLPLIRVPSTTRAGETYARFRLSSQPITSPVGEAIDGEVEDYKLLIQGNPYSNPSNKLDVNNDNFVSPIDALQIINFLNINQTTQLTIPVNRPLPPYLDVNGDGFVSPNDALIVINFLNARAANGEGEGESADGDQWIASAPNSGAEPALGAVGSQVTPSQGNAEGNRDASSSTASTRLVTKEQSMGPIQSGSVLEDPAILGIEDLFDELASDVDEQDADQGIDSLFANPFWE